MVKLINQPTKKGGWTSRDNIRLVITIMRLTIILMTKIRIKNKNHHHHHHHHQQQQQQQHHHSCHHPKSQSRLKDIWGKWLCSFRRLPFRILLFEGELTQWLWRFNISATFLQSPSDPMTLATHRSVANCSGSQQKSNSEGLLAMSRCPGSD